MFIAETVANNVYYTLTAIDWTVMKLRELRHLDTVKFRINALRLQHQVPDIHALLNWYT
jgi:hypothetical protein